jgi:hypothetical protein
MIFGVDFQDVLDVPSQSLLGNNTSGVTDALALTPAQVRILIGVYSTAEINTAITAINTAITAIGTALEEHTHTLADITDISPLGAQLVAAGTINEQRILLGFAPYFDPTLVDATATHNYYGGSLIDGAWKINRYDTVAFGLKVATIANNPTRSSLAVAWTNRYILNYA